MTRAFPRCRERRETRLINDCCSTPGSVSHDSKSSFWADHDMYRPDHGFPVTTIRPRPIVAAAIAVQTDSKEAPLDCFGTVRRA